MVKQSGQGFEADETSQSPLLHRANQMSLRKARVGGEVHIPLQGNNDLGPSSSFQEIVFVYNHHRYNARLDSTGLTLVPLRTHRFRLWRQKQIHVAFNNVLSVDLMEKLPWGLRCRQWLQRRKYGLALCLYAAERSKRNPNKRKCRQHILLSEDPAAARGWALEMNSCVRSISMSRPTRLLVFVNPKSGSGKAKKAWSEDAHPLLQLAGVECLTVLTEYAGHARQYIEDLKLEELKGFEGILAVGGDGMFKEVLEGILAVRARGGQEAMAAEILRLAQIPAGSTDAVAWTLHGTRSAESAALEVALGSVGSLDVMRVDSGDGKSCYSVCYAAYGYMGDLMRRSEHMRWLGPLRYTLSGIIAFLMGKSYEAKVFYMPTPASNTQEAERQCTSGCDVCASGVISAVAHDQFSSPARQAFKLDQFKEVEGVYRSVMLVVTPCRSDMSPAGLSPLSHLSDGRLQLILVKACSQLQYLHFLATIPSTGILQRKFDFVEILDVSAVRVIPYGPQSSWNVDGELLKNNFIETEIHRGLVQVFSQGPYK